MKPDRTENSECFKCGATTGDVSYPVVALLDFELVSMDKGMARKEVVVNICGGCYSKLLED